MLGSAEQGFSCPFYFLDGSDLGNPGEVPVAADGTFELQNVVPGFYNVQANRNGKQVYGSFEMENSAITDLLLTLPE